MFFRISGSKNSLKNVHLSIVYSYASPLKADKNARYKNPDNASVCWVA
jgi:hypothetical protein